MVVSPDIATALVFAGIVAATALGVVIGGMALAVVMRWLMREDVPIDHDRNAGVMESSSDGG